MKSSVLESIEHIDLEKLIPYARNSRTHSNEQVARIMASIQEFGFTNPVLIDEAGTIIAGHGRVLAATRMELSHIPCLRLTHLTEAQKRAYVIADNQLALSSSWDSELLGNELGDLHTDGFDLGLLGFDPDELAEFVGFDVAEVDLPELASGDREPYRQMTFTLHDSQAAVVDAAIAAAKNGEPFSDINDNVNGNALARIAEAYSG